MLKLIHVKVKGLDDNPNRKAVIAPKKKKATSKTAYEAYGILQCNSQDFTTQICSLCFHFSCFIHINGSWYLTVVSLWIFNFYLSFLFMIHVFTSLPKPKNPQTVHCECARERGGCVCNKLRDWWHLLISSALVS